jgi:hypothetical protein
VSDQNSKLDIVKAFIARTKMFLRRGVNREPYVTNAEAEALVNYVGQLEDSYESACDALDLARKNFNESQRTVIELAEQIVEADKAILELARANNYMAGIAARGRGYPLASGEKVTEALLRYVQGLEGSKFVDLRQLEPSKRRIGDLKIGGEVLPELALGSQP